MVNIDILNVKTKELVFHALPQLVIMVLYAMGLNRQTHHMYRSAPTIVKRMVINDQLHIFCSFHNSINPLYIDG